MLETRYKPNVYNPAVARTEDYMKRIENPERAHHVIAGSEEYAWRRTIVEGQDI